MGRSSSTGLPFLVLRPDVAQFTDQQSILADIDALRCGRAGQLTADQMVVLCNAETALISTISSDIDTTLTQNGLDLAKNHPDRRRLGLELLKAQVKANEIIKARPRRTDRHAGAAACHKTIRAAQGDSRNIVGLIPSVVDDDSSTT